MATLETGAAMIGAVGMATPLITDRPWLFAVTPGAVELATYLSR